MYCFQDIKKPLAKLEQFKNAKIYAPDLSRTLGYDKKAIKIYNTGG